MSDKNIEIIRAIKATGEWPKTSTINPTKVATESLSLKSNKSELDTSNISFVTSCLLCDDIIKLDNPLDHSPKICLQCKTLWEKLKHVKL